MSLLTLFPGWSKVARTNMSNLTAHPTSANAAKLLRGDATWVQQPTNFVGVVAGGSVPATASAAGDWYYISSAGTSQSVTWAAGDMAIYKGTSGQWAQLAFSSMSPLISPYTAGRQSADYLQSDGATTNRRIETQYGTVGAVAGSDLTEVDYVFDVPSSNPSGASAVLCAFTSVTTGDVPGTANTLSCYINTSGSLRVRQSGADGLLDYRLLAYDGFRAAYSARRVRLTIAFSGGSSTAPVVYLDGVNITSSFTETSGGTIPNWVSSSLSTTYHLRFYNWPGPSVSAFQRPGKPVNRKYAQSDVDFVQMTGRLPQRDTVGGRMGLASGAAAFTNFQYDTFSDATGTGFTAVETGGQSCEANNSSAGSYLGVCPIGTVFRLTFTATLTSGAAPTVQLGKTGVGTASAQTTVAAGANVVLLTSTTDFTAESGNGAGSIRFASIGNTSYAISALTVERLGALSDPIIQPCLALDDATPNNRASVLVGFTPVTNRKDWRIPAYVDMSSTGNKQLLSGAVFDSPTKQALDTIETTCAGTPTFSIGDGTTATKYTASVAHTATRLRETLSANFPADSAKTGLYANVTGAHASSTSELIIVRGHRE